MKSKFDTLQVYRGIAAMLVVIYHISGSSGHYLKNTLYGDIFSVGWCGVDFFFVLSGFIITYVHYDDIGEKSKLYSYLKKRIFRIYPSYWILSTIALIMLLKVGYTEIAGNSMTLSYIIKSYFLMPGIYPFWYIAWSLCYEVFFYIIFAILIWQGMKGLIFIATMYTILIILNLNNFNISSFDFFFSGYNIEFIFGCSGAIVFKRKLIKYNIFVLLLGACLFFITYYLCYDKILDKSSIYTRFLFGLSSFIIISQSVVRNNINHNKYLISIGNASFSLYLIHPLIMPIFFKILSKPNYKYIASNIYYVHLISIVCFIVCIIVALNYYKNIENPLIKKLNEYTSNT